MALQSKPRDWPVLSRPPIVEGLIDVRIARQDAVPLGDLLRLAEDLADRFPSRSEVHQWSGEITMMAGGGPSLVGGSDEATGYLLRSARGDVALRLESTGLTVAHLSPYRRWASLREDFSSHWTAFHSLTTFAKPTRVAVRFINRIETSPSEPLSSVFRTFPAVSEGLPSEVAGFLLRLVMLAPEIPAQVTLGQLSADDASHVLLDIDAVSSSVRVESDDEMFLLIERLRDLKNRCFFESLSESTIGRYQ